MSNTTLSSSILPSMTSSTPSPTSSAQNSGNNSGGGPSSPLLFFVALGFGVVFTNLWIIVGVKYCFRYNQRNRARLNGEDPDAMDMAAMPRQRRRREKKLMSMEEVNERFPLVKYKTWRSTRAAEGLPTAGGIAETTSRPASIKEVARPSEDESQNKGDSTPAKPEIINEKTGSNDNSKPENTVNSSSTVTSAPTSGTSTSSQNADPTTTTRPGDEEDPDQIQNAIPAEQLPDPGDMCAICIDVLEDDDDIRGLTCGHAFHASCLDPWLTSRRACCPLCKADYYVPKPRPEGEAEDARRRASQADVLQAAGFAMLTPGRSMRTGRRGRTLIIPARFLAGNPEGVNGTQPERQNGRRRTRERAQRTTAAAPEVTNTEQPQQQQEQTSGGWRQRLGGIRMPAIPAMSRTRDGRTTESGAQPTTPAQMEEGRITQSN